MLMQVSLSDDELEYSGAAAIGKTKGRKVQQKGGSDDSSDESESDDEGGRHTLGSSGSEADLLM